MSSIDCDLAGIQSELPQKMLRNLWTCSPFGLRRWCGEGMWSARVSCQLGSQTFSQPVLNPGHILDSFGTDVYVSFDQFPVREAIDLLIQPFALPGLLSQNQMLEIMSVVNIPFQHFPVSFYYMRRLSKISHLQMSNHQQVAK